MNKRSENKIILVTRLTRLEELIYRYNTIEQAKFYVEHMGADFSDYLLENSNYQMSLQKAEADLKKLGRLQIIERTFLPNFIFSDNDTIVVLGQDGLVVNTAKYLTQQPIIAINPDPKRWDGLLLPFIEDDLTKIVPEVFNKKRAIKKVTMAKAELNDGQKLYAVNDLFIGQKTHKSARYMLKIGSHQEQQSSSGIIVSTGLGATGWLTSILVGANAISSGYNKTEKKPTTITENWNSNYLYYTVREPFPSKHSSTNYVFGKIQNKQPLTLTSQMPENGIIFSDGIETDYLTFNSGLIATISIAEKKAQIVI